MVWRLRRLSGITLVVAPVLAGAILARHELETWRYVVSTNNAYVKAEISTISSKLDGYVAEVLVEENQPVRRGQVLAIIDDDNFAAEVAKAESKVLSLKAALLRIDRQIVLQDSSVAEAEANRLAASAEQHQTQLDLSRLAFLRDKGLVTEQRFESATAAHEKAVAGLKMAASQTSWQRGNVGVLVASRAEAEAELKQAEASLRIAENDLDDCVIRAPGDGLIANIAAHRGEFIRAGRQLMMLVPQDEIYVEANFKETQIADLNVGQRATITLDAFPDIEIEGRVVSFAPASGAEFSLLPPENATGNFTKVVQRVPVRIGIPEQYRLSGLLRPGLSVVASVDTRTREPMSAFALNALEGADESRP